MSKKVLVTGASGFAGSYLVEHLLNERSYNIIGTYLSSKALANLESVKDKINLEKIDLLEKENVFNLINKTKPDLVFHLAALPSPPDSFKDPSKTITNNILAEVNVLEALKNSSLFNTRILIVSSGDIYGMISKEDLPIDEDTKLNPTSPYAVSKIAQDFLGLQYFLSYKLKTVRVRPFNHIGPRQSPGFAVSSFARRIAEIEKGRSEPVLEVGNLNARRDFTDVRDTVRGYVLILEKGIPGDVYNIGSGRSHKIEDILDMLISIAKVKVEVKINPSLFRPIDEPELLCDNRKFVKATEWKQTISIKKTLEDTLDYWRNIV